MKALVEIGAARRFTHGVQSPCSKTPLQVVYGNEMRFRLSQPFREAFVGGQVSLLNRSQKVEGPEISPR